MYSGEPAHGASDLHDETWGVSTMTVTVDDQRDRLYAALRSAADTAPMVGDLLTRVASEQDADVAVVAAAMWDLVEREELEYGSDAHVRRVAPSA